MRCKKCQGVGTNPTPFADIPCEACEGTGFAEERECVDCVNIECGGSSTSCYECMGTEDKPNYIKDECNYRVSHKMGYDDYDTTHTVYVSGCDASKYHTLHTLEGWNYCPYCGKSITRETEASYQKRIEKNKKEVSDD